MLELMITPAKPPARSSSSMAPSWSCCRRAARPEPKLEYPPAYLQS